MEIRRDTARNVVWLGLLLLGLAFVLFTELRVTQNTTILFGDEGYWAGLGRWTAQNLEIPKATTIYSGGTKVFVPYHLDTYFHPLFTAGLFILGGELLVKASSALLGLLTGLMLFLFVRRVYGLEAGVLSALLLVSIPSFITYSVLVYVDVLFVLLTISSLYMLYRALSERNQRYLVLAGLLAGFAALTKETGFLLLPIYFFSVLFFERIDLKVLVRKYAVLFGLFALMILPWYGVHNYLQFGSSGIPIISDPVSEYTGSGSMTNATFAGQNVGQGTEADLLAYGLLNYASFAYSLAVFFLALLGFALFVQRQSPLTRTLFLFTAVMLAVPLYLAAGRAEDAARFALPTTIVFAAAAGVLVAELYDRFRQVSGVTGKIMPALFILVLALVLFSSTSAKAESLAPIKNFPAGFYEGCDWIRENTPQDARLLTLWVSRASYHCQRDFYWSWLPDLNDIVLSNNETLAHSKLQEHGIEYIYIQKFSIDFTPYLEAYPISFVHMLDGSELFEKAYENDDVIVYRVK